MSEPINDVEGLEVYQVSLELSEAVYRILPKLPVEERFELARQLRKAAVSVPSNISEGYARRSPADYRRFLCIAAGSNREITTQLEIAVRVGMLTRKDAAEALALSLRVGQMLTKLIKSLAS